MVSIKKQSILLNKEFSFNKKYLSDVGVDLPLISERRIFLSDLVRGSQYLISFSYPLILWVRCKMQI